MIELFDPAPFRWWFTGGLALELHLGRAWRAHDDTDVSFVRTDAWLLRNLLADWDIGLAAVGRLTPWDGHEPRADRGENNLWCRRSVDGPWLLDVTVSDGDRDEWIFRRDPSLRVPWNVAVLQAAGGEPYLAPELQLLFKSREPRPKDDIDAVEVIPVLGEERRRRLARRLVPEHPWQALLGTEAHET